MVEKRKGQAIIDTIVRVFVIALVAIVLGSLMINLGRQLTVSQYLSYLSDYGYIAYADNQGVLHVTGLSISGSPPLELTGDAKSWIEFRPDLDPTKLAVNAKPTPVVRGVGLGYSLPVGGADEELFYNICVPGRWDGESDIHMHVHSWLDNAQDEATDAVKLKLEWQHVGVGDVVPATNTTVVSEEVVGVVAQYMAIQSDFVIDYDIDIGNPIEVDDILFFRLTRIASSHEIVGEPVIMHAGVIFKCDKYGNPTYE